MECIPKLLAPISAVLNCQPGELVDPPVFLLALSAAIVCGLAVRALLHRRILSAAHPISALATARHLEAVFPGAKIGMYCINVRQPGWFGKPKFCYSCQAN